MKGFTEPTIKCTGKMASSLQRFHGVGVRFNLMAYLHTDIHAI